MSRLIVMMRPGRSSTGILAQLCGTDVLRAKLPPPKKSTGAAALLLESLARWYGQPVFAVIYAGDEGNSSDLDLCDGFDFGRQTSHFEVEVHRVGRRSGRQHRLGSFDELRRLARRGVS